MRTCIISWTSSNFGQIWPPTTELAALERRKNSHRLIMGKNEVIRFSRLFLIWSFSCLQVMRTYIKAYMSLNFGQIPPLTTELAALECLKNRCHHVISVDIDPIFFKLAGNKDMHNITNEFEFLPDRTVDYGVSCTWASKKYPYRSYNGENGVSTFSLLFLIGSFWYFHVTRTSIKAWMSLNVLKWDLTLAHWTQVSDRCPLGYLFSRSGNFILCQGKMKFCQNVRELSGNFTFQS